MIWRGVNGEKRLLGKIKCMLGGKIVYTSAHRTVRSIKIYFAFPRKTSNVMLTQPSPRNLIGFGITPAPSTGINPRSLRSFRSCLQVDPCWFTSMQGFGRNGPRSKSGRMIDFYFLSHMAD